MAYIRGQIAPNFQLNLDGEVFLNGQQNLEHQVIGNLIVVLQNFCTSGVVHPSHVVNLKFGDQMFVDVADVQKCFGEKEMEEYLVLVKVSLLKSTAVNDAEEDS